MEIIGILIIAGLAISLVVVAGKGVMGKGDLSEDDGIDYDPDGVILFDLSHK